MHIPEIYYTVSSFDSQNVDSYFLACGV